MESTTNSGKKEKKKTKNINGFFFRKVFYWKIKIIEKVTSRLNQEIAIFTAWTS
jgi:hypothetical protein